MPSPLMLCWRVCSPETRFAPKLSRLIALPSVALGCCGTLRGINNTLLSAVTIGPNATAGGVAASVLSLDSFAGCDHKD